MTITYRLLNGSLLMFSFSFRFFIKRIGKREIDPYLELKNLGTVMLHASRSPYPM